MNLRNWIGGRPVVYKWQGVRLNRSELRWNTCRSTTWKNSGLKRNKTRVLRKCKNDLRQNVRQMMQREKYTAVGICKKLRHQEVQIDAYRQMLSIEELISLSSFMMYWLFLSCTACAQVFSMPLKNMVILPSMAVLLSSSSCFLVAS